MADREAIIRNYIAGFNEFNTNQLLRDFDKAIVFENIVGGEITMSLSGLPAFKEQAETAMSYFSKRTQTITSFAHQNDETIIQVDYDAVLAMDFPNGLKKGDRLTLQGTSVFRFSGDKIIKLTDISQGERNKD